MELSARSGTRKLHIGSSIALSIVNGSHRATTYLSSWGSDGGSAATGVLVPKKSEKGGGLY